MLIEPVYRKDYEGEVVTDGRKSPAEKIFVKPKKLFYRPNNIGRAMVIGNGTSRLNKTFSQAYNSNIKRAIPGYKLIYGCNGAMWDIDCDYYVISNRILMGHIKNKDLREQLFLPWDMFIDYKTTQMVPHLPAGLDAGTMAAFLACFDGNHEVYLFGFDGYKDIDTNQFNVYADKPVYSDNVVNKSVESNLYKLVRVYKDVTFYKVGGGKSNIHLASLPNFKEVTYNQFYSIGDF